MKPVLLFIILSLLTGCASLGRKETPAERARWLEYTRSHVFLVDEDGRYRDAAEKWGLCSHNEAVARSEQIEFLTRGLTAFARTNHSPNRRVVVFVHGGMNPYDAGYERLKSLTTNMLADNCYPIFLVWNSGLLHCYWEHLTLIRQGERRPIAGPITMPFVLTVDLAKGVARFPVTLTGRIENDIRTVEFPDGSRTRRWELFENTIASNRTEQVLPPVPEGNARSWPERTRQTVGYFITLPTKIGILPILDGVGTEAWDLMLRRTQTMFWPPLNNEFYNSTFNDRGYRVENADQDIKNWLQRKLDGKLKTGGMYDFSQHLARWTTNDFKQLPFEFYGHSMGTIVINELLRVTPGIATTNIVYMGAACSIRDFEQSIFPYLRQNTNAHFYSLSLHRIRERLEGSFFDLPPRGSLLNWIDDIFEKPKSTSDRTLGAWENIVRALPDVPDDLNTRTHLRACNVEPCPLFKTTASQAQTHGDFDNFPFWQTALYWREAGQPQPARLKTSAR